MFVNSCLVVCACGCILLIGLKEWVSYKEWHVALSFSVRPNPTLTEMVKQRYACMSWYSGIDLILISIGTHSKEGIVYSMYELMRTMRWTKHCLRLSEEARRQWQWCSSTLGSFHSVRRREEREEEEKEGKEAETRSWYGASSRDRRRGVFLLWMDSSMTMWLWSMLWSQWETCCGFQQYFSNIHPVNGVPSLSLVPALECLYIPCRKLSLSNLLVVFRGSQSATLLRVFF